MQRRTELLAAAAAFLLAGCDGEVVPQAQPEPRPSAPRAQVPAPAPEQAPERPASAAEGSDAAAVLRRYYDHIEAGRYEQAHAMREPAGGDVAAFAAHFGRFQSQRVTIGVPSEPVAAGQWLYVEVPVQSYGAMKDGSPFGSAGTVTLRRGRSGGTWRIYTK